MIERVVALTLLGIMTACLVVMTIEFVMTLHEARRMLKQLHGLFEFGHRMMEELGAMVGRAHRASRALESVIRDGLERVEQWPSQVGALLMRRWGNGVGADPHRRSRATRR